MWHDKIVGRRHAKEGKMSCGMTRCWEKVMPKRGKKMYGMTGTGAGTREKEKASSYRGARQPPKLTLHYNEPIK